MEEEIRDAQYGTVTDLEDKSETRAADAERPLQCDVLCLKQKKSTLSVRGWRPQWSQAHLEDVVVRFFQTPCNRFALRKRPNVSAKKKDGGEILQWCAKTYFASEYATVKPEVTRDVDQFDIRGHLLA